VRSRIEIIDEVGTGCSEATVAEIVRAVLDAQVVEGAVAIVYVDEQAIAELNGRYRGEYEPTDVLSFSYGDDPDWPEWPSPEFSRDPGEADNGGGTTRDLGEVIICPAVVRRYAEEDGRDACLQLGWTIVHGVLHLLGGDHELDGGDMRRREQELLRELGPVVSALSPPAKD